MSARWTRTVPPGCQAIGSEQLCPARVRQLGDASSGAASKRREVPRINTPRAARRLPVRGRRRNTPMRATCLRTNGFVGRTDPGEEFSPNGTSYARQPGSVPCHARRSWPVGPLTRMRLCGHLALAARSSCCGLRLVRGPRFFPSSRPAARLALPMGLPFSPQAKDQFDFALRGAHTPGDLRCVQTVV